MEDIKNRKYVARLVYAVLTERKTAREAILLFPETKDKSIEKHRAIDDVVDTINIINAVLMR